MAETTIQERVDKATRPIANRIAREDPIDVIAQGSELIDASKMLSSRGASLRRAAVRQLRAEGWTLREIASATGLTSARISQIETGD